MTKYKLVACGGTFDLLHAGHKSFIQNILKVSKNVVIGLTSDAYVESFKEGKEIEPFENRKKVLEQFLTSINAAQRVQIVPIDDYFGPLLSNEFNPQAIAVTSVTEQMAIDINQKRKAKKLPELEILKVPLKTAQDEKILSATRIRNGEINRSGRLYVNPKWRNSTLVLPESLRLELQHPWGEVLFEIPKNINPAKTVTIGDINTQTFNQNNVGQFLSIIDFLVQRQPKFHNLLELGITTKVFRKVKNLHGTISLELFQSICEAFKNKDKKVILVEGEEDLAVLPVMLVAPLGYSIFYGQPNVGMVKIQVTEENKEKAYQLVSQFEY